MTAEQRIPVRPFGREPVRPIPAGHTRPVQYIWPSQAHLTPTHCTNCGARLLRNNLPTAAFPLTDLDCIMCSRTACELLLESSISPARPVLTEDELKPRRGRPPGKKRWAVGFDACVRCSTTEIAHNAHGHCERCKNHLYRASARIRQQQSRERRAVQS